MPKKPRLLPLAEHLAPKAFADHRHMMELIGKVAQEWATVEHTLCVTFQHLSGMESEAALVVFFTPGAFRGRLEIVENLALHVMPAGKEKEVLRRHLDRLARLNRTRNTIIHGSWELGIGKRSVTTKRNVVPNQVPAQTSERANTGTLQNHILAVRRCWRGLDLLNTDLGGFTKADLAHFGLAD